MMLSEELNKKAQAAFLGVALGDALGATTEFMTPSEIKAQYKVHKKIRGGGWLGVKPGQVTDDTEMSLAISQALLAAGEWDLQGIADNFLGWMRNKPIDIGATVRKGIRNYMHNGDLAMPPNDWDAGNGALMRMAPVALFTLGDDQLLQRCTLEQAHLTHNHPLSDAACICVGRMVHAAIFGADRFQLHAMARELFAEHRTFRFNNYKGLATGYVVDTLQTVLHYFFSTASFEECLIGVVNQGGDADTTGAIAGMLAGAFYGLDELPRHWLRKLDRQVKTEIEVSSDKLINLSPGMKKLTTPAKETIMEVSSEKLAIADVAAAMKTTTLNVMMHIKRGLLSGEEIDGDWYVLADTLAEYQKESGDSAHGNLCKSSCGHGCSSCG
ncbi:MAG: ADP-ribosyl-[dinitrogen reductase] hydrolase [Desulfuromusa sp.]|nr:ADP-ribosyl-[dinitrogen reductase] hydrolase [Desulfuromusa sp.]